MHSTDQDWSRISALALKSENQMIFIRDCISLTYKSIKFKFIPRIKFHLSKSWANNPQNQNQYLIKINKLIFFLSSRFNDTCFS